MKETRFNIKLNIGSDIIECIYLNNDAKETMIIVGGDDDLAERMLPLAKYISQHLKINIFLFTNRMWLDHTQYEYKDTILELESVIDYIRMNYPKVKLDMVCTSSGAISTTLVGTNPKYKDMFSNIIYLDPADYYMDMRSTDTWNGNSKYLPDSETISNQLSKLKSDTKIHVANFILRNSKGDSYVENDFLNRGTDYEGMCPRLNNDMVKSFYTNTPKRNRGLYIENNSIPHSFLRDGDIRKNQEEICNIIKRLLLLK